MRRVMILFALILLTIQPCLGAELDIPGLDEVWRQAEEYGAGRDSSLKQGISDLLCAAADQFGMLLRTSLSTAAKLVVVVLLCSLAEGARPEGGDGLRAVTIAGVMAITALTMTDMAAMIGLGRDTMEKMEGFSTVLLPVMAALTAAAGSVSAAAVQQGATVLFSQLLITVMDRLLIPLVYAYVAVCCAYAAVGNPGLKKVGGLLKGAVTSILTALLLAYVGYLTASGAVAGTVDAGAVKTAKMAISRAIPVVGGILADASESVLAGAGILKGSVGAVGLIVVLAICLTPFLRLALQYLVYKCSAALCAAVAQPELTGLIDAIGSAFGLVLGMTGAGALVLMVSLVSAIRTVVA